MSSEPKDNFSENSSQYARYRPLYPGELYDFLLTFVKERNMALDCGTGNGQAASVLADTFSEVHATDISKKQMELAQKKPNLFYHLSPAEKLPFDDNSFDLVVSATAIHWFQLDEFYAEIRRVAKNNSVFACWAYKLVQTDQPRLNELIDYFYTETIHSYWDAERRHVDAGYRSIRFPFEEIANPGFTTRIRWDLDTLEGYLNTWSAVQHFIKKNNNNPVSALMKEVRAVFDEKISLHMFFPIFMRIGFIKK